MRKYTQQVWDFYYSSGWMITQCMITPDQLKLTSHSSTVLAEQNANDGGHQQYSWMLKLTSLGRNSLWVGGACHKSSILHACTVCHPSARTSHSRSVSPPSPFSGRCHSEGRLLLLQHPATHHWGHQHTDCGKYLLILVECSSLTN